MSSEAPSPTTGELPDELFVTADGLFGEHLAEAELYAEILATDAVVRGLIGPHEASRIWDRHLLNCAIMHALVPPDAYVIDVGSGAGLPGVPLALARPDLRLVLLEPLLRRVTFLDEVVDRLGLTDRVDVVRGRADDPDAMFHVKHADVATARAVAPLDRLARWTLPLIRDRGLLLAMKGSRATEEVAEHRAAIEALGGVDVSIETCGADLLDEPTTVVRIVRDAAMAPRSDGGDSTAGGPKRRSDQRPAGPGRPTRGGRRG